MHPHWTGGGGAGRPLRAAMMLVIPNNPTQTAIPIAMRLDFFIWILLVS
jgi:hypothetical protein